MRFFRTSIIAAMAPLVLLLAACMLLQSAWSRADEPRIAFLGDSIAYDGRWTSQVESALRTTPGFSRATIVNLGLPSETVSGLSEAGHAGGAFPRPCLHERLERLLAGFKPDIVIACYGMNDAIYQPFDEQRFAAFRNGMETLKRKVEADGARFIGVTPPLHKPESSLGKADSYNSTLDKYAAWMVARRVDGWQIVNIRPALASAVESAKAADPNFVYAGDGIHPGDEGHRMIADAVIDGLAPLLGLPERPAPVDDREAHAALFKAHQALKHAWLSQIRHSRPGIPAGKPVDVATQEATALLAGWHASAAKGAKASTWNGFRRIDMEIAGRPSLLVFPARPAPGNPWIWRTEFFGHEPQADIALLGQGFHVAYIDMQNLYGGPRAMEIMDQFHFLLAGRFGLSPRPVLEGFSRGGLFALNWAARNPASVAALYLDAPVCDFKSWPAGKGKGKGSPDDWKRLLEVCDLSEAEALAWKHNPVDNLAPIAKARIPIVCVMGEADDVVPPAENIDLLASRYKALGGPVDVIRKAGVGHHPHSLRDPAPVVRFLLRVHGLPCPTAIACIGDSIVFGHGTKPGERWSDRLAAALPPGFGVHNHGISGRTLLDSGDFPYRRENAWREVLGLRPDVVVIGLGTNDSKAHNWARKDRFAADYKSMIADLRQANPAVRILCLQAVPAFQEGASIDARRVRDEVNPLIAKVAAETGCTCADLHAPLTGHADFIPDKIHPDGHGHAIMAERILATLRKARWVPETTDGATDTAADARKAEWVSPEGRVLAAGNRVDPDDHVRKFEAPVLRLLRTAAPAPRGTFLVLPGGGYGVLSTLHEGASVGRMLNDLDFDAAVLEYPIAAGPMTRDLALAETLRAWRLLQSRHADLGLRGGRFGLIGFSAGAHLAARTVQTLALDPADKPADELILVYPAYLEERNRDASAPAILPPEGTRTRLFALIARNDKESWIKGAETYVAVWKRQGAPAVLHLLPDGGHGFGMRPNRVGAARGWPDLLKAFLAAGDPGANRKNTALLPMPKLEDDSYDWHARHRAALDAKDRIRPEVVLIGDSITHFWGGEPTDVRARGASSWKECFDGRRVLNLGFGWDRIQNALWRVQHGELDGMSPTHVIIAIGTNNTAATPNARANTPAEIAEGIQALAREVRSRCPTARIIVMKLLPRGRSASDPMRAQVMKANTQLDKVFAPDNASGVLLLDAGPGFLRTDGTLRTDLMPDALHPNDDGYRLWSAVLKPALGKKGPVLHDGRE